FAGPAGLAGLAFVGAPDRLDQLGLGHRRAALDVEALGQLVQVRLGRVGGDALGRAAAATGALLRRLGIARAAPRLRLPVVADLLERVLERRECRTVAALALAVGLDRRVVRLDPGLLRLLRGAPEGAGQFLTGRHGGSPSSSRSCVVARIPRYHHDKPDAGTSVRRPAATRVFGTDIHGNPCDMALLLWILAVVLVVSGIVSLVRGQVLWGIVLIIVGLLVGPGGVSVFQ